MQVRVDKEGGSRGRVASLVAALFVILAMLVVNLPGEPLRAPDILANGKYGPHFEFDSQEVEHGWPYSFVSHEGFFAGRGWGISPWRIGKNARFSALAFLVDACIAAVLSLVAFTSVRRRVRVRGWQVTLREFAIIVLCISVPFALLVRRRNLHQAQVDYLHEYSSLEDAKYADWEPFGPYWLRQLTGDEYWQLGDRLIGLDVSESGQLAGFPGKESIQVLRVVQFDCESPPALDEFTNLKAVDIMLTQGEALDDHSIDWSRALPMLAKCTGLDGLNLYEGGISNRDLRVVGTMANLENLCLSVNYDIDDHGLVHLASLKKLRQLELWDTGVTSKGVARLQKSLPECEIHWNDPDAP